jgi:excinuclease UvrABC nuclease subunit
MPFVDCAARSFTVPSVRKNAPELSGVYGLSNAREWLFVGQGNNIRAQLLAHLNELDTALMVRQRKAPRAD